MKRTMLLLTVLVLTGCSAARRQQASLPAASVNTVTGTVYDYLGPVADVRVRMTDKDGNMISGGVAGPAGQFAVSLPADTRMISFSAPGYITREVQAEDLEGPGEDGTFRLDVELTYEKSP